MIPCKDPKEEQFCVYIAQGRTRIQAYRLAFNPKAKDRNASSRGSEYGCREDLARRIVALQVPTAPTPGQADSPSFPDLAAKPKTRPGPEKAAPGPEAGSLITREELARTISEAVREATTPSEKTQAAKLARDLLGLDASADAVVDPAEIVRYVATAAGRSPQEIAADVGGLRWMLERVIRFSRVPPSHVQRTLGSLYRHWLGDKDTGEDTGEADVQAGKDLLSDDVSNNSAHDDGDGIAQPEASPGVGEGDQS